MKLKEPLDYLLIPDSSRKIMKERRIIAKKELGKRIVYNVLIMKGKDSEEDILYLGKILKSGDRIGFDTFPLHYKEYKVIIKKCIKEGKFPKDVKIENVRTSQGLREEIYGNLGLEEEKLMHEEVDYVKNRRQKMLQKIKNFVKKLIN